MKISSTHISGSHSRELCVGIVSRSDLDYISRHDVQTVETSEDRTQLARRPSSGLWSTCSRREGWVNRVNLRMPDEWMYMWGGYIRSNVRQ